MPFYLGTIQEVQYLISKVEHVNAKDDTGKTALDFASKRGNN